MSKPDVVLELARFIERVAATARTGLAFKPDGYDNERYTEMLEAAAGMHAFLNGETAEAAVSIAQRWRASVKSGFDGYVTTGVGVGIIVFNPRDEVLLIQRPNHRWWYPTGFCEVGLTPAENAAKEAREEVGLAITPLSLMGVFDSRKQGSLKRHLYSMLFYCRSDGGELRPNPLEALDARFFALDRIPEPLHIEDRRWIQIAREFHFDGRRTGFFDPL